MIRKGKQHFCKYCYNEFRNIKDEVFEIPKEAEECLVTKTVEVKWKTDNKMHYENLGYEFTGYGKMFTVKTVDLTKGSPIKIECKCSKCGQISVIEYRKFIKNIKSDGIYKCGGCFKYTQKEVEEMFSQAGYKVIGEYKGSNNYIWYICPKHGKQKTVINNFIAGMRGRRCAGESLRVPFEDVKAAFENRGYTLISEEYNGSKELLEYRCNKHPEVISKIKYNDLQQGHGCPLCGKSSKGELEIKDWLDKNNKIFALQYTFDDLVSDTGYKLRFDFAVFNNDNSLKTLIEFDGKQHYEAIDYFGGEEALNRQQQLDTLKNEYCQNNNLDLLRIPYTEFFNLEEVLSNKFGGEIE